MRSKAPLSNTTPPGSTIGRDSARGRHQQRWGLISRLALLGDEHAARGHTCRRSWSDTHRWLWTTIIPLEANVVNFIRKYPLRDDPPNCGEIPTRRLGSDRQGVRVAAIRSISRMPADMGVYCWHSWMTLRHLSGPGSPAVCNRAP